MHIDIKKLYNENQELQKEICELKSIVTNSNIGGSNKKKRILNYDTSWLMVCIVLYSLIKLHYYYIKSNFIIAIY